MPYMFSDGEIRICKNIMGYQGGTLKGSGATNAGVRILCLRIIKIRDFTGAPHAGKDGNMASENEEKIWQKRATDRDDRRVRNRKFQIWLSDKEFQLLADKADYCHVTKADFVRTMVVKGAVIRFENEKISKLLYEVNKIGVNINQIAKKVNTKDAFLREDYDLLQSLYHELFNEIVSNLYRDYTE